MILFMKSFIYIKAIHGMHLSARIFYNTIVIHKNGLIFLMNIPMMLTAETAMYIKGHA